METVVAGTIDKLWEWGALVVLLFLNNLLWFYVCKTLYLRNTVLADRMLTALVQVNTVMTEIRDELRKSDKE